jgi:hypothetical protein
MENAKDMREKQRQILSYKLHVVFPYFVTTQHSLVVNIKDEVDCLLGCCAV